MAYCPSCGVVIPKESESCDVCGTQFGPQSRQPLDAPRERPRQAALASLIFRLGLASVLVPLAGFLAGLFVVLLVPGCECHEDGPCRGCGADGLVAFLLHNGLAAGLVALVFILPVSAGLAALVSRKSGLDT